MPANLNKIPGRAVLYPQDIVNIMGVTIRTAYRMMDKIWSANQRPRHNYVLIQDFSDYTGIPEQIIQTYLPG